MWFTLGPAEWPKGSWPLVSNQTTSRISCSQPFSAALILALRPLFLSQRQSHCVLVRRECPHKRKKSNYWMKEMLKEPQKKKIRASLKDYHIWVQFSRSVVSNSLWAHEPQHARSPYPSPTPGVHPNPCPLSRWCHPTISSSVIPYSSCPKLFLASGSFQISQLFAWGGQSIGVSALASVLPKRL